MSHVYVFIAPKKDAMEDFWYMIWEQNCSFIVMLANLLDNGKVGLMLYFVDRVEFEQKSI